MSQTRRGLRLHLHPPTVPTDALRLSRTWGLGLLATVVASIFTGYLLPSFILVLCGFHFWKVRKAQGVVLPQQSDGESSPVPTSPQLIVREGTVALMLIAGVPWLSVFADAPLAAMANPGMSPNPAKAPWYFLGIQELLVHLHPLFAVAILPGLVAAALVALPYLPYGEEHPGTWFVSPRGRRLALGAAAVAAIATPLAIWFDETGYRGGTVPGNLPSAIAGELVLVTALLLGLASARWALRRHFGASPLETVQTLLVFLVIAFAVCTITGIWFRGPGMALVWP